MKLNNLVELLRFRAERNGCGALYTFLGDGDGETAHLTFGQLDQRARAIGAHLQQLGMAGERALLKPFINKKRIFQGRLHFNLPNFLQEIF